MSEAIADAPELAVVLGGGTDPAGTLAPASVARAHRAAQLAHERPELAIIASGGPPAAARSEAELMRDVMVARGVAPARIAVEDESADTLDNAVLVSARYLRELEPRPLYVVTSPFHLERATETFRHVLGYAWQVQAVASDETPDDLARAAAETERLKELAAFVAGIRPGDLRAIVRRLLEREPGHPVSRRLPPR